MKLSEKKEREIVVWEYFMPKNCKFGRRNDDDVRKFFEWSERGMHKELLAKPLVGDTYFEGLVWGKVWAGRSMQMFEEGVLEGTMPYMVLLSDEETMARRKWYQFWKPRTITVRTSIPREIVDFMRREMFRGRDSDVIEDCYVNNILR